MQRKHKNLHLIETTCMLGVVILIALRISLQWHCGACDLWDLVLHSDANDTEFNSLNGQSVVSFNRTPYLHLFG